MIDGIFTGIIIGRYNWWYLKIGASNLMITYHVTGIHFKNKVS